MLSKEDAEQRVAAYLESLSGSVDGGVSIMPQETIQRPYGWVFFFNSRRYLETGDPLEALGGNSPVLVDAETGELILLGTSQPVADSLRSFEIERGLTSR